MGFREVKVYDGEFPTYEQIISGDPTQPPFPKEIWLEQMRPGEFAVRFRDGKTGLPIEGDGKVHGRRSEATYRIYDNLAEVNLYALESTRDHMGIHCRIIDNSGTMAVDHRRAVSPHAGSSRTWMAGVDGNRDRGVCAKPAWLLCKGEDCGSPKVEESSREHKPGRMDEA